MTCPFEAEERRALMFGKFLQSLGDASSSGCRSAGLKPRAVPSRPSRAAAAIADNDQ
jgi:hypothetical protein